MTLSVDVEDLRRLSNTISTMATEKQKAKVGGVGERVQGDRRWNRHFLVRTVASEEGEETEGWSWREGG